MKPRTCFVAAYVALALVAPAHAQIDCAAWNTEAYFEAAEVSDVTRCLQAGMDLEARSESGSTPLHTAADGIRERGLGAVKPRVGLWVVSNLHSQLCLFGVDPTETAKIHGDPERNLWMIC